MLRRKRLLLIHHRRRIVCDCNTFRFDPRGRPRRIVMWSTPTGQDPWLEKILLAKDRDTKYFSRRT